MITALATLSATLLIAAAPIQTRRFEDLVVLDVRAALDAALGPAAPARALLEQLGRPDFYDALSAHDPNDADAWHEMARVQRQFAAAERRFDPRTRAYTESMRLTLHAAVLLHLADPRARGERTLHAQFLILHVTAFRAHGGWVDSLAIPRGGAAAVLEATRVTMLVHAPTLLAGSFVEDEFTRDAARWVQIARAARESPSRLGCWQESGAETRKIAWNSSELGP